MMHPVFRLAVSQPMLLATHVGAYASLASEELLVCGAVIQRRLAWQCAAALSLAVAATLAGVSVLLWVMLPPAGERATWVLMAVPLLPAVLGLGALWRAQAPPATQAFSRLRAQLAEDAVLLARYPAP